MNGGAINPIRIGPCRIRLCRPEARLAAGFFTGTTYFNIHTSTFGGGEIRGFLVTPEPATLVLLGLGLAGVAARLRKKRI